MKSLHNVNSILDLNSYKKNELLPGLAVAAPMVTQSDLAFRLLCRRYGSDIAYTPMLHAREFLNSKTYRINNFHTVPEDTPVFAQFCGNEPKTILEAAKLIENEVDAVDINFGCPQAIARKGYYGAYLLGNPQLMCEIIYTLSSNLSIPVTCKIRKLDGDPQYTLNLARELEAHGCSVIAIHGRYRDEKGVSIKEADWDIISNIAKELSIPIFANGGISSLSDARKCLEYTKCSGVMVAEAILEDPALFSGRRVKPTDLFKEYLDIIQEFNCKDAAKAIKPHAFKLLYPLLKLDTQTYQELDSCIAIEDFLNVVNKLSPLNDIYNGQKELRWYYRHGVW